MAQTGRPSIYGPKDGGRIQALAITKAGEKIFEAVRRKLKQLHKWPYRVSDGDVIDHLVRNQK